MQPDVYAVQGYDAAQMYEAGLRAAGGDPAKKKQSSRAWNPPPSIVRAVLSLSRAHNPVQDIYMREVKGT